MPTIHFASVACRRGCESHIVDQAAGDPLAIPARARRLGFHDTRGMVLPARDEEDLGRPPMVDVALHEKKVFARAIEVEFAGPGSAREMAEAIACAEIQNLMAMIIQRDPDPAKMGWADPLLGYVSALPNKDQDKAVKALAGTA